MLTVISWSTVLGRIIRAGSAGQNRVLLEKGIVIALRELVKQASLDHTTYDLVAFIALSLKAIGDTVDESVAAWEKRGYWIKADHYRMEWNWADNLGGELLDALLKEDWGNVTRLSALVSQKLIHVKVSTKHRLGKPWVGSWDRLVRPNQSQ